MTKGWPKSKDHQASKNEGTLGPFKNVTGRNADNAGRISANVSHKASIPAKPDVNTPAERPRPWTAGFSEGAPKADYGKGGN